MFFLPMQLPISSMLSCALINIHHLLKLCILRQGVPQFQSVQNKLCTFHLPSSLVPPSMNLFRPFVPAYPLLQMSCMGGVSESATGGILISKHLALSLFHLIRFSSPAFYTFFRALLTFFCVGFHSASTSSLSSLMFPPSNLILTPTSSIIVKNSAILVFSSFSCSLLQTAFIH